jgi:hypothetical protein
MGSRWPAIGPPATMFCLAAGSVFCDMCDGSAAEHRGMPSQSWRGSTMDGAEDGRHHDCEQVADALGSFVWARAGLWSVLIQA